MDYDLARPQDSPFLFSLIRERPAFKASPHTTEAVRVPPSRHHAVPGRLSNVPCTDVLRHMAPCAPISTPQWGNFLAKDSVVEAKQQLLTNQQFTRVSSVRSEKCSVGSLANDQLPAVKCVQDPCGTHIWRCQAFPSYTEAWNASGQAEVRPHAAPKLFQRSLVTPQ